MDDRQFNYLDLLQIVSLAIGLQNLSENRQQSRHNDVQAANDQQAHYLLDELARRFDEQDEVLRRILKEVSNERKENA